MTEKKTTEGRSPDASTGQAQIQPQNLQVIN